jgi:predicted membrane channel-forming protein YqfA (hemolysin III family)
MRGAGGTEGGLGLFFIGVICAVAGGWLLMNQVTVTGGAWTLWGYNSFGLSLVPFIAGVGLLFFNGRSPIGWLLLIAGLVIILAGVLMNMRIYFQPTSLFNTLMMLALLAGGIGLLARSLRSAERAIEPPPAERR